MIPSVLPMFTLNVRHKGTSCGEPDARRCGYVIGTMVRSGKCLQKLPQGQKPYTWGPHRVGPTVRRGLYRVYWSFMGMSSSMVIQSLPIPITTPTLLVPLNACPALSLYGSLFDRKPAPSTELCSPVPQSPDSANAPDGESCQHANTPPDSKIREQRLSEEDGSS